MNHRYLILATIALSVSANAQAQAKKDSTLHQSMTIERNFSPIVRDANKIDQQPETPEIKVKNSPTRYADWIAGEAKSGTIGVTKAGQVIAEEDNNRLGYVEASAGNYINLDLKAGLQINHDFSVELDGFFTQGDLDLPNEPFIYPERIVEGEAGGTNYTMERPELWESKFLDGNLKLNYNHLFSNNGRMRAYVLAGGRKYNMLTFSRNEMQTLGRIWADAIYTQDDWYGNIMVRHTGINLPDMADDCVNLKGGYGWNYDEDWQLRLSLDMAIEFGESQPFTFMPELEYSRFGEDRHSRFYIHFLGGTVKPDLYELMSDMPLLLPCEYKTEKVLFDATFGYEDNNRGDMKWGIYAGAKLTLDRLDALMSNTLIYPNDYETKNFLTMVVGNIYHAELTHSDEFEVKVGGYFDYRRNRTFGMKGAANLNTNPQFGKALFDANMHFIFTPTSRFNIDLGINCDLKREMDFWKYPINVEIKPEMADIETIDLGNIFDLSLRADYQLLPNLDIFLYGKNLLNQEYQLWAGVPAQKINLHAGLNWKF